MSQSDTPSARAVARHRLDDLRPHPELLALVGEPPSEEVERLAHRCGTAASPTC